MTDQGWRAYADNMIPTVLRHNPMMFDPETGNWVITTDFFLPNHALQSAAKWCRKLQVERSRSLVAGDKRDLVLRSIAALDQMSIKQNLINPVTKTGRGDLSLFEGKR